MKCVSCDDTEIHKSGRCIKCHRVYRNALQKAWRKKHPEKMEEYAQSVKKSGYWKSSDRKERKKETEYQGSAKHLATNARYKARRRCACPNWLTPEHHKEIEEIYAECKRMSETSGIPHHVDHIVPLGGEDVCGLHVPWNLQIIPAEDNFKKSNKHEPLSVTFSDVTGYGDP